MWGILAIILLGPGTNDIFTHAYPNTNVKPFPNPLYALIRMGLTMRRRINRWFPEVHIPPFPIPDVTTSHTSKVLLVSTLSPIGILCSSRAALDPSSCLYHRIDRSQPCLVVLTRHINRIHRLRGRLTRQIQSIASATNHIYPSWTYIEVVIAD